MAIVAEGLKTDPLLTSLSAVTDLRLSPCSPPPAQFKAASAQVQRQKWKVLMSDSDMSIAVSYAFLEFRAYK